MAQYLSSETIRAAVERLSTCAANSTLTDFLIFRRALKNSSPATKAATQVVTGTQSEPFRRAIEEMTSCATTGMNWSGQPHSRIIDMLDNGWAETNRYGEAPKKVTFRETVVRVLAEKTGESYAPKLSLIERVAAEQIQQALKGEFAQVINDAARAFRAQVDSVMTAKLGETLKAALGIR